MSEDVEIPDLPALSIEVKVDIPFKYTFSEKMVILIVLLLIFISTASANMLIPSYPQIIADFNVDPSMILIPDSIGILVEAIVMVLWGYYTDRLDRNKVIHGGIFISTIGFVFTTFCTSFEQLLFARMLAGAGLGFAIPVGTSILMDIVPSESRSGWFGFLSIFSSISNATGQGLAAFVGPLDVLNNGRGWQFPFLILSGVAIFTIILLIFVRLPEMGSREEDLAELQKFEDLDYDYKINKKEFIAIIKKKTNIHLILNGFFCIIPGTIMIYTMITTFADPQQGLLVGFPQEIVTQTATILAGMVGIGYNIGSIVLAYFGDKYNQKDRRNRTRISFVTTLLAIPFTLLTVQFLRRVNYVEIGSPETVFDAIIAIFTYEKYYIGYLFFALIGSFMGAGYVSNKRAIMIDVNLPEHRGTASSLIRLTEQIGKSITLMLTSAMLAIFGSYIDMLRVGMLFWIPSAILWYFASKTVAKDMDDKAMTLKERQQTTFIDYFFEMEIAIDGGVQMIQDAKDLLVKNPKHAEQLIEKAINKFKFINSKSKLTNHLVDIEKQSQELLINALMLKSDLLMLSKNPKKEDLELLQQKIDEVWEESDFGKIEILYEDAYLRVCEARLRRNYNPIESIFILKKAIEIYGRVVRLTEDRLKTYEESSLTADMESFQQKVADLLILAKKSQSNTEILRDKLDMIVEEILKKDINREDFVRILELTTDYGLKLNEIIADTFGGSTARKVEKATEEINELFNSYDDWMQKE